MAADDDLPPVPYGRSGDRPDPWRYDRPVVLIQNDRWVLRSGGEAYLLCRSSPQGLGRDALDIVAPEAKPFLDWMVFNDIEFKVVGSRGLHTILLFFHEADFIMARMRWC